jgi:hypothetical protein
MFLMNVWGLLALISATNMVEFSTKVKFGLWDFSKFSSPPKESLQHIRRYLISTVLKIRPSRRHSFIGTGIIAYTKLGTQLV